MESFVKRIYIAHVSVYLLIAISSLHCLYSQTLSLPAATAPSPTAASFAKYGDYPVSHHTGVPEISIPIYTIEEGGIRIPISLSYHSSGVKVDETSSWVGLGWNLNAGGVITRSVVGARDEGGGSGGDGGYGGATHAVGGGWYSDFGIHPELVSSQCLNEPNQILADGRAEECAYAYLDAARGLVDTEPDIFTFNVNGYSGKFVFDENRTVRIIPHQDIKIIPTISSNEFDSWCMITPDGTKYFLGGVGATEKGYYSTQGLTPSGQTMTSTTWYLKRVESPNASHFVDFTYQSEKYSFGNHVGHGVTYGDVLFIPPGLGCFVNQAFTGSLQNAPTYKGITDMDGIRLSGITTSSGLTTVSFDATTVRQDLSKWRFQFETNTESKALDAITIQVGESFKRFELGHSYFTSPGGSSLEYLRLRLDFVEEQARIAPNTTYNVLPRYIFSYNPQSIANRYSMARDHWGYYNGATSNTGLLPNFTLRGITYSGLANREPSASYMKACILERIQYPTGGVTDFEYEPHKESPSSSTIIGGLRVKKITNNPNPLDPNSILAIKNFTYNNGVLYGGTPAYVVDHMNYANVTTAFPSNTYIIGSVAQQNIGLYPAYILSEPIPPLRGLVGYHIGYSSVTVDMGANTGLSIYTYHNTGSGQTMYPFIPIYNEIKLGVLQKVEHKDNLGVLKQSITYNYSTVNEGTIYARRCKETYFGSVNVCMIHQQVLVRQYEIIYGKLLLNSVEEVGEVTTTTTHTYSSKHNQALTSTTTSSTGEAHQTYSNYPQDQFSYTCSPGFVACDNTFNSQVQTINTQLAQGQITMSTYQSLFVTYQDNCVTCKETARLSYDNCISNALNTFKSATSDNLPIGTLIEKNILSPTEVGSKINQLQIGGQRIKYTVNSYGHIVPYQHFMYETSAVPGWNKRAEILNFDNKGRVLSAKAENGQPSSTIWEPIKGLMLAQAVNTDYTRIAYTSFETQYGGTNDIFEGNWKIVRTSTGGWSSLATNVRTGSLGFSLTNSPYKRIESGQLPEGSYVISFWYRDGRVIASGSGSGATSVQTHALAPHPTTMTYFEGVVKVGPNGLVTLTSPDNSTFIDELRLYPIGAQMSTYCYDLAYRIHTSTDVNNISTYYEYDVFNRLRFVKDQDGNILKRITYGYAQ